MDDATMSTPVTRGELREEIKLSEERLEQKFDQKLDLRFEAFEQKLDQRFEAYDEKLEQRLAQFATKADLEIWGGALLERMLSEIARHFKASEERMLSQIRTFDDKYADLPGRVRQLEATVFEPE